MPKPHPSTRQRRPIRSSSSLTPNSSPFLRPTLSPATPTHQPWSRCGSSCTCAISAALGDRRRCFSGGAGWQGSIPTHRNAHFFHDPHRHLRAPLQAPAAEAEGGRDRGASDRAEAGQGSAARSRLGTGARQRQPPRGNLTPSWREVGDRHHQAEVAVRRRARSDAGGAPATRPPMRCGANWVRRATAKWMTCGEHPGGDWVGRTVLNTITG